MKKSTWRLPYESCNFSQHGEDGIVQLLTDAILEPNRFVFEIGWGSGKENMSRNLLEQGWSGIGIDCEHDVHPGLNLPSNFEFRKMYVDPDRLQDAFHGVPRDLDFFSLDIDSFDFEVASWALHHGYRPKTVCLEFNHRFGPTVEASFPWAPLVPGRPKRVYNKSHFHGVSLAKYQSLWQSFGYCFFTIDSSEVNVFFYHPDHVDLVPNLVTLGNRDLASSNDVVYSAILDNTYWAARLEHVYQPFILHSPIDACAANSAPMLDPENSNGIERCDATTGHDRT